MYFFHLTSFFFQYSCESETIVKFVKTLTVYYLHSQCACNQVCCCLCSKFSRKKLELPRSSVCDRPEPAAKKQKSIFIVWWLLKKPNPNAISSNFLSWPFYALSHIIIPAKFLSNIDSMWARWGPRCTATVCLIVKNNFF